MHRALANAVAAFAELEQVESVPDVGTGTGLVLRALHAAGARQLTSALLEGAGLVHRRHQFWTRGGDTVLLAEFEKPRVP